jgi:hypothetical protein
MLNAIDESGCSIDGVTTNSGTKNIFSFDVSYSGCSKSGNYTGVLTLEKQNGVAELSWMAFDDSNQGVFGNIDTQITQDEALELTGKLKPSLYLDNSAILISKADKLYSLEYSFSDGTKNPFVFTYAYNKSSELISGQGNGVIGTSAVANATVDVPVTPEMEIINVSITYSSTSINYPSLSYASPEFLLDSVEGRWGQLNIDSSGILSGSIQACDAAGLIDNYEEQFADISISLTNCSQADDYTGVIVGVDNTLFTGLQNDIIIAVLFSADGSASFSGVVGKTVQ